MSSILARMRARWFAGFGTSPEWSVVRLHPEQVTRHRAWCHRCGLSEIGTHGTMRVRRIVGGDRPATRLSLFEVQRRVRVPMCGACRYAPWMSAVGVLLLLPVPLALGFSTDGSAPRDPLVPLPPWAKALAVIVWFGALLALGGFAFGSRFDVVFDGEQLRYSFEDGKRAQAFAVDNGAVVEVAGEEPARTAREHDPDGVDHTGLHGDVSGDGGGSD